MKGKAGMFPELKTPEVYAGRDVHFEAAGRRGARQARAARPEGRPEDADHPADLQRSEREEAGGDEDRRAGRAAGRNGKAWSTADAVKAWKPFVQGFGPAKEIVAANPDFVKWAHAEGMTVIPYTFRTASPGKFPDVTAEMTQFLYTYGVDGLFTDNPDKFPRK